MVFEVFFQLFLLLLHLQFFENLRLDFDFLSQDSVDLQVGLNKRILMRLGGLLPLRLLASPGQGAVTLVLGWAVGLKAFNALDLVPGRLVFVLGGALVHLSVPAVHNADVLPPCHL